MLVNSEGVTLQAPDIDGSPRSQQSSRNLTPLDIDIVLGLFSQEEINYDM